MSQGHGTGYRNFKQKELSYTFGTAEWLQKVLVNQTQKKGEAEEGTKRVKTGKDHAQRLMYHKQKKMRMGQKKQPGARNSR